MAEAMLANQPNHKNEMISIPETTTKTKDCFILPQSNNNKATESLNKQQQQNQKQHHSSNNIIGIIPSSKRQKLAKPTHELVRTAIEGINLSISKSDRLSAIGAACATFDHDYSTTHDEEVRIYNADSILLKHLTLLLYKKNRLHNNESKQSNNDNMDDDVSSLKEEIGYTCSALEMVCRCNATTLSTSFNKFGYELLEVIVFILKDFYNNATTNNEYPRRDSVVSWDLVGTPENSQTGLNKIYHSYTGDFAVNKATKILCHVARVGSAIEPLAKHHGIMAILQTIIDTVRKDDGHNYQEARLNTLWIIANLACAPENMVYMANFDGLLDTLLKVVVKCGQCNDDIDNLAEQSSFGYYASSDARYKTRCVAARGQAIRSFLNLSWAEENKITFSNMTPLLKSLLDLISPYSDANTKSTTTISVLKSTKRHAAGTLRNIAAVQNTAQKLHLCTFDNNALITSLTNVLCSEELIDDSVRERIYATFYNLCCKETISILQSFEKMIGILKDAANSNPSTQVQIQDNNTTASDIQELAQRILKFIETGDNEQNEHVDSGNNVPHSSSLEQININAV